ncbi:uncharacterized protein LOC111475455 [Cucurbita maxima]|uniref:Uncharacterized protein LOC111475455 n=1 Tax=Cucurbita maxima TaxID=3661 RepID=A0A6J1IJW9_CUCMA|nr:uncharacterized protein LOC111475455 [Cucurbita maxima]
MAPPSHRSSSPSMVAGRTSPNSRNSEIVNPTRRSFSSEQRSLNFNTPMNSPSDYPRRNSTSRENLFNSRDNEEKENGKNQSPKPVRIRSPAAGKSTKNFMSPTISAASKISVSPKKKILGDRNELVRSSLSFSGLKSSSLNSVNPNPEASAALESDTNQEIAPISNPKKSKTVKLGGFEVITGSESTYRHDPEVAPVAVETDTKSEIAPISKSTIAAAPLRASKTVKSGGLDVISDSHSNSEVVTMAVETDAKLENSAIAALPPKASETVEFADVVVSSDSINDSESPAKNSSAEELDTVGLNSSFKDSLVSSSMEIAPLDADPLMPRPYDPKTNYLSPRPQFLHYKPRRINQLELDGKLEELFSSESEFTEGTDSEDPQMKSDEVSSNESHMKEEEREEEEEEEEMIVNVSEQSPVEAKTSSKLHFSRIFKISSLLLILLTACFSISVVNVHDLERASLLLPMEDSTEVFEFAKTNFNVLMRKFEVWHANSRSYISDMVFNIGGRRPLIYLNQTGFLHKDVNSELQCLVLSHQTSWEEENDLNVMEEARKEGEIDIVEEPIVRGDQNEEVELLSEEIEAMKEREIVIEHVKGEVQNEEESFQEIEANANDPKDGEEENGQASAKSASEEPLQENEEGSLQEIIEETSTKSASDILNEEDKIQEKQTEENYEDSSTPDFIHDQIEQEAATGGETKEEQQNDSIQQSNAEIQHQSPPVSPPPSAPQSEAEDENGSNIVGTETNNKISRDFSQNTAVIASAILLGLSIIIIPAGLIYARKSGSKRSSMAAIAEAQEEPPLLKEKKTYQSPAVPEEEEAINDDDREDIARKGLFSSETSSFLQYSSMKEVEEAFNGDDDREEIARKGFCSSETSSFLQYSSMKEEDETETAKKLLIEAQNHSHGRKTRKNSRTPMASSSLDEFSVSTSSASPSYGSFTTYEKIPIKHGNEEEEIVTPVRRSSRIRKTAHR